MKKLMLPLFVVLFFAACQNATTTTTPAAETQNLPAELKIEPTQVKEANAKAKASLQNMNNFMEELNTASATMTSAQKAEVEVIRSQLNDVMGKQETMQKGLDVAETAGPSADGSALNTAVPPPGVLQDYIQSAGNYDKFVEELRTQLEAIRTGKSKQ